MKDYRLIIKITSCSLIFVLLFSICFAGGIVVYATDESDSDSIKIPNNM